MRPSVLTFDHSRIFSLWVLIARGLCRILRRMANVTTAAATCSSGPGVLCVQLPLLCPGTPGRRRLSEPHPAACALSVCR